MQVQLALSLDDVSLVPRYSELDSRDEVQLGTDLDFVHLDIPIISSPMDTVTGIEMQDAIRRCGGIGIHHRYTDTNTLIQAYSHGGIAVSPSMGTKWLEAISEPVRGYGVLVIDVAHGHSKRVLQYAKELWDMGFYVISGNICTVSAAEAYLDIGVNLLRVGIGSGSSCSTRLVAGVGVPQFTAVQDISRIFGSEAKVISDGGIKHSGDITKALAAGANAVMVGRLVAGADEAPGRHVSDNYKEFRGMASLPSLDAAGKERNIEGVASHVKLEGPLSGIMERVARELRIGFAYLGAHNIQELQERAEFVQVTTLGLDEGRPRI